MTEQSPQGASRTSKRSCGWFIVAAASIILLGTALCGLALQRGANRNDKLLSGRYDTIISKELGELATPTVEAIIAHHQTHGQYPKDIDSLDSQYKALVPASYMDGRLIYIPETYYGAPFFFGFRGNYSGWYSMHGWAIVYCPEPLCTIPETGTRRIDDTWIFIHSSAL